MDKFDIQQNLKYLQLLAKDYPSVQKASAEIISLEAQMKLPKGTEMYMSDIHGEDEAFSHILNNASGVIREKIDVALAGVTTPQQRAVYASLIYYPARKLAEIKMTEKRMDAWYRLTLYRLIDVCRHVASKNTRRWVRNAIPKGYEYVIDELLHAHFEDHNKEAYYNQFISAIIDTGTADDFIEALSAVIKRLAVHKLHIVGDIFDRGSRPDVILDKLMRHHSVDIQWGNHDVLWLCGATGSPLGVASVIRICAAYNNLEALEEGYGINLRPLAIFASQTYGDCSVFKPRKSLGGLSDDELSVARIHKAISVIMYKLECQVIDRNPNFEMEDRKLFQRIDFKNGTVNIDGRDYPLKDTDFPTVDPDNPIKLSQGEIDVMQKLRRSFMQSEKLQAHAKFLYSHGSVYKVENGILMYHGVVPMNEDGTFRRVKFGAKAFAGKELFDYVDKMCRLAYFGQADDLRRRMGQDILWYLWCGKNSPMFGRNKMATFEGILIEDNKELKKEGKDPYYLFQEDSRIAEKILKEFGLEGDKCRIINGHVPVKASSGEDPIKAGGKIIVIDGGFSRAYHNTTGIAGYTMVYSSRGLSLRAHRPFTGLRDVVFKNTDIESKVNVFETMKDRMLVEDTDQGVQIRDKIDDLKMLIKAFNDGLVNQME